MWMRWMWARSQASILRPLWLGSTKTFWYCWSHLGNVQESYDAEYVAVFELFLAMKNQTHYPDWSKWASNYYMVKTNVKDFRLGNFFTMRFLLRRLMCFLSSTARTSQSKLGHTRDLDYEKMSFKGSNNGGGGGSSNKQITYPCSAKFVPRMPNHLIYFFT